MLLGIWGVLYVAEAPAPWLLTTATAVAFLLICRNSSGRPAHFPEIAPLASP
jgi:hypothetical protein